MTGKGPVPETSNRGAFQYCCDYAGNGVTTHERYNGPDPTTKSFVREDAHVQEANRDFGEVDGKFVQNLQDPEILYLQVSYCREKGGSLLKATYCQSQTKFVRCERFGSSTETPGHSYWSS